MQYLIKNGRVIDPIQDIDDNLDILIADGKIEKLGKALSSSGEILDAKGKIVIPGLIDMHTHLREPGREDEETIRTGTRSAIRGAFTSVVSMANTEPAVDNISIVKSIHEIAKKEASSHVFVMGAMTKGRLGKEVSDIKTMRPGIVALSDDGSSVEDEKVMLKVLKCAKENNLPVVAHCEDIMLSAKGVVNQGFVATKTGLKGMSRAAEFERVERDIDLAKKASWKIHIAHVSLRESVELIRKAKKAHLNVTAECTPHHLALTEECCVTYDTNTKMNPPLRTKDDVTALKTGLSDGTIDAIATDHAPHTDSEKYVEFDYAPFGIIGLETALSLAVMELVDTRILSLSELVRRMSSNPAKIFGLKGGSLKKGSPADIAIVDLSKEYIYKKDSIESKSKNSPFIDWKLKARATDVFVGGRLVMKDEVILTPWRS